MITAIAWALVACCLFVAVLYVTQRSMMYFPGMEKPSIKEAAIDGLGEITVKTEDGLTLYGWYKAPDETKPTIVFFHGNASSALMDSFRALPFAKAGYGILLTEYRGYNGNPGHISEQGLYKDGRAFLNWLKDRGVSEDNIIVNGESLGTGPAVQMASEYPGLNTLILVSPFTTMTEVAAIHYPFLPVRALLKDKYDNLSKIKTIKMPLIVVHAPRDMIVPFAQGKALFDAAPEPKSMITIDEGGHGNLESFGAGAKIISLLSE